MTPSDDRLSFAKRLTDLHSSAGMLYDRARAEGQSPEQCASIVAPLAEARDKLINEAVKTNLPGVVVALKTLETEGKQLMAMANYFKEKADNVGARMADISHRMVVDLQAKGEKERSEGEFSVTMVSVPGPDGKPMPGLAVR